jgi:hypothetical protein
VLLVVALAEVAVNRIVVPWWRPEIGEPPLAHTVVDYVGLFLFYFTGALAAAVLIARSVVSWRGPAGAEARPSPRDRVALVVVAVAAAIAATPLVVITPAWAILVEFAFAVALVAIIASAVGRRRDLGVQVGLAILAVPLWFHTLTFVIERLEYPDGVFHTPGAPGPTFAMLAILALALASLATPYCFAPRPFARAVSRPIPIVVAMAIAAAGAVVARVWYPPLAKLVNLAIGIELDRTSPDQKLALYLLAVATLAWTITACATASTSARRGIGLGIGFVLLGGYQFEFPHHFLLPLVGFTVIADAGRRVREQELDAMPYVADAPPVADPTWSSFVGASATELRRVLDSVHTLTMRGDGGLSSTMIVGSSRGFDVRTRIERLDGSVVALDVVIGREMDEVRGATLTLWASPPRGTGQNPQPPPAAPLFRAGDPAFDEKFRLRGNASVFAALFDDAARGRAITALDGWLAYWEREGLRYRVYPGRGAPLDHPLPLSDLALGRVPPNAERLVAVVELLVELATRVLEPEVREPQELSP